MAKKVKQSFSISEHNAAEVRQAAKESDESMSAIVDRALDEYFSRREGDSTEELIREIHAEVTEGDGQQQSYSSKNKTTEGTTDEEDTVDTDPDGPPETITADTSKEELPATLKGNGYSKDERIRACAIHASEGMDRLNEESISSSINDIWSESGPSPPTLDTYIELVGEWLEDNGWHFAPAVKEWYRDEDEWRETVEEEYEKRAAQINNFSPRDDPEEISETKREVAALGNSATNIGHISGEELANAMQLASELEEAAKKNENRDDRRGSGEKYKNRKNNAFR